MPDWNAYVRANLRHLAIRPAREEEIIAELTLQLEQACGAARSEEEALTLARRQIADWSALAHEIETEEALWPPIFSGFTGDLRYAFRFLRRNPAFAALAVFTLAFGIGANTSIFTLVDAVVLRHLPYRDPGRLMAIETRKAHQPEVESWASAPDFFDLRDQTRSFSSLAGISPIWQNTLSANNSAERVNCLYVSAAFFPMLGVNAALGRTFQPQEDRRATSSPLVVLSDRFWQSHFAGSRDAVGKTIEMNSAKYTVIGVLPRDFRYAGEPLAGTAVDIDFFVPLSDNPLSGTPRSLRFLKVIGRLKPQVTVEQARDEVRRFSAALAAQYPASNRDYNSDVQPLGDQVRGRFRLAGLLLLSTVGFVLLMACANVANLLLARAAERGREISVRVALGASRFRLLRQLLTEGLVLATVGGLFGLVLSYLAVAVILRTGPETLMHSHSIQVDGRALLVTMTVVLLSAMVAGLPPAWRMLRTDLQQRGLVAGANWVRSALVVVQVSAALILLVGAGLLVRSFARLLEIDPGFQAKNLATISTQIPVTMQKPEDRALLYRRLHDEVASLPGVVDLAAVSRLPLMGSNLSTWLNREGRIDPEKPGFDVEYRTATPNYFQTMGIPIRGGRIFDDHDPATAPVLVINEAAARRIWPGENPVGQRVKLGGTPDKAPWLTVIGVVGNVRHVGIDVDPLAEVYRPYAANPLGSPILVIRTSTDSGSMLSELANRVRSVNSQMAVYNVLPMQSLVDRSTAQRRFVMLLLGGFSAIALLLAAVGIYGTVSQAVAQRTPEIGLRMALGASPTAALRMVLGQGFRLALVGVVCGTAVAIGLTRLMGNLLFEVRPLDPLVFSTAAVGLALVALLACYIPARRATRVDPLAALRGD